jgi:hypothetical protein
MSALQSFHQTPLYRWAETQPHLSCERLLGMLAPVTHRLRSLHDEGTAHGGLTPDSLLVSQATQQIDLDRFISCKSDRIVRGSPYAPPEADFEPSVAPSPRTDIYSLAAALYHALNGQPPVSASTRRLRGDQLAFSSPVVTPTEQAALRRALALDPALRPAKIAELEILLRISSAPASRVTSPTHAQPITPARSPWRQPARAATPAVPLGPPAPKTVAQVPANLTKGKPCGIPLAGLFPTGRASWLVSFLNLEELGLRLDEAGANLTGTPLLDGEHTIRLQLQREGDAADRPKLDRSIKVTINPDPAAIWKNLPSNRADSHWKPDTDHLALPTPDAFVLAASVRGRSHAQEGLFRDDDFRLVFADATGWHLLAVADGAGSAKLSRRGAQLACQHALDHLVSQLRAPADESVPSPSSASPTPTLARQAADDNMSEDQARSLAYAWLGGAAHAALKAITDEAAAQEPPRPAKDYATTLLLSAARRTSIGWIVLSFGIGDGGIGLLMRDGSVRVMSTPDTGEFSSETIFLTSRQLWMTAEGISQRRHVALVPDFTALVLMTDGITDPLFPTEVSLGDAEVWHSFWTDLSKQAQLTPANEQADEQLLAWAGFYSKGNHDDRTLALLLPRESGGATVANA